MTLSNASYHVEACVIGAGVIGLATARALAMMGRKKEVLILEREKAFGLGTSSRNSEVIHAGLYYPSGSLKARLCVKGKHMLYDYCQERHIDHDRIGKLIVATNEKQWKDDIPMIRKHALANGVDDLQILSSEDVTRSFEPEITCVGALFSPSTGIVDSHALMLSLLADAEEHGATMVVDSPVDKVIASNSSGNNGIIIQAQNTQITCDLLVNCAGLHADKIARMIQTDHQQHPSNSSASPTPRQYYAKGNYYRLEGQPSPFQHLIYPVPSSGGLGVHATMDLGGNTRFGPDVEWISPQDLSCDEPDDIDLTVNSKRSESFYNEVRKYWPGLKDGALQPDYAGIRPKLNHPDVVGSSLTSSSFHDFYIEKLPNANVVNLLGMESPGLTASMAIADYIMREMLMTRNDSARHG